MEARASHMLEAALEQMDGIIAGKMCEGLFSPPMQPCNQGYKSSDVDPELPLPTPVDPVFEALQLMEVLRAVLEGQSSEEKQGASCKQTSTDTANVILKWLQRDGANLTLNNSSESYQERLSRLEGDKESLILQELVHRTSLEKQKLNLMGEVSYLKLKLADMEGTQVDGAERQHKAETVVNFISELQEQMCQFQKEINSKIQEKKALEISTDSRFPVVGPTESPEGRGKNFTVSCDGPSGCMQKLEETPHRPLGNLGEGSSDAEQLCHCGGERVLLKELRILKDKVQYLEDQKLQYEKKLKATKAEIGSLQQLLLTKNAEIESLHTQLLARPPLTTEISEREEMYRKRLSTKYQELQRLRSGMKSLVATNDEKDRQIEELTLLLNQCRQFRDVTHISRQAPSAVSSLSNGWTASSSSEEGDQNLTKTVDSASTKSDDVKSEVSTNSLCSQQASIQTDCDSRTELQILSSSLNDINGHSPKFLRGGLGDGRSQTLPVNSTLLEQNETDDADIQRQKNPVEDGDSCQRKLERAHDGTPSENSPAHCEAQPGQRAVGSPEYMKNNRSFKRFWGKLRRTQSGGFQPADPDAGQFRRGGLRATAGPRLTRTPESNPTRDLNIPFSQWTKEQVCGWLEDYGLGQYINLTRQWVENGQTLLAATPQDFEKEMGMKHPLHRKKLQLALRAFTSKVAEKSSELDHIWVTRWLDDIGLPQYKDQFHEARVDGRMIQYLTVNDLLTLKVTSQLHHLSIKCAIHVLHANKFNPNCLRRRPGEEKHPSPSEVVQWSNHCVMEWLRAVDLAEYAPNLRGSGVHGGLIILEPRFSSETLALLLNIPPQKTLLRRHLATAFAALVGPQAMQEKREYGNATGHVPLTTTAKVKPKKLGFTQFSHLRKRKPDESADYICPIDSEALTVNGVSRVLTPAHRGFSSTLDRQAEKWQPPAIKAHSNVPDKN
ncbi:PREDICTED: liprin-beta-2-like isoform X4 [Poecilia mexicana]|uniref:liprin-beta-2-like isoform X4 n=1 Tax=Poecilia mexicana TaxID=48701 RepID=UPI00072EEE6A|nr:PREDICTED: liprin-beta-2-like isoform X4 [Poecilia mexicana]